MLLGILQNDASLLACRLAQLRDLLRFDVGKAPDAIGAGYVESGQALLRHMPGTAPSVTENLLDLISDVKASSLLLHARRATVGSFKDENTHPFRYRNWLFAHSGTVSGFGDLRRDLLGSLPEYLQRTIGGETDSEHVFAVFLDELRKLNALEDRQPGNEVLSQALAATVQRVEAFSTSLGAGPSSLNIIATNGRVMVACRHGGELELCWAQLGGLESCELHGLAPDAPETHAQRLPHRNMRSL
ncbi:MAG: class II glutamine amidotransferase, partial [Myxococcota bacterium]